MSSALSIQFKRCRVCGKEKPLSRFHLDAREADGHRTICMTCRMQEAKKEKRARQSTPAASARPSATPGNFADAMRGADMGAPEDAEDTPEGAALELDAPDEPAQSAGIGGLFEAMKGNAKPARASAGDEKAQMAGVVAGGGAFVLRAVTRWAIPDPYKPAAPTREHALAIVSPLAEELTERADVAGMVSPTTVRLAQSTLAIINYGEFALDMITQIHAQQQGGQHGGRAGAGGRSNTTAADYARARGIVPVPAGAAAGAAFAGAQDGGPLAGAFGPGEVQRGAGDAGTDDRRGLSSQVAAVDALLHADADGRARLGLV